MNNKNLVKLAAAALLVLPLSACVVIADGDNDDRGNSSHTKLERQNRDAIAGLSTGMSRADVVTRLGTPEFDDQLTDGHRVLFYRTQRKHGDGMTSRDECTPLIFDTDKLIGWGDLALQRL
ncbi:DUF3192 domain-containing protein [Gallaecimonas xiamenensis]|uniref:Lipoprotein n=1 Tax=Gallaecimonas xiamenensis 3-C-1 TaxID=745411 RepID=K2IID8_9GAMM|nr:DUF3192 domain-containing protein [Gallaecimonas xiamenensis]EKE69896.1 hypothetical protein B3C1_14450 [Gallaecimonas xiamenensis 3-C-1]